jgi:hypothetical protein
VDQAVEVLSGLVGAHTEKVWRIDAKSAQEIASGAEIGPRQMVGALFEHRDPLRRRSGVLERRRGRG